LFIPQDGIVDVCSHGVRRYLDAGDRHTLEAWIV